MKILPLEVCSVLTEINKELDRFGLNCIVIQNGKVERRLSMYEILNHMNAAFPDMEVPFCELWTKASEYIREWEVHIEKYLKNR